MATPKISTQASTPTFPTGAALSAIGCLVNDIREITGWSENTARKFMRESASSSRSIALITCLKAHSTNFSNSLKVVPPTLTRR